MVVGLLQQLPFAFSPGDELGCESGGGDDGAGCYGGGTSAVADANPAFLSGHEGNGLDDDYDAISSLLLQFSAPPPLDMFASVADLAGGGGTASSREHPHTQPVRGVFFPSSNRSKRCLVASPMLESEAGGMEPPPMNLDEIDAGGQGEDGTNDDSGRSGHGTYSQRGASGGLVTAFSADVSVTVVRIYPTKVLLC